MIRSVFGRKPAFSESGRETNRCRRIWVQGLGVSKADRASVVIKFPPFAGRGACRVQPRDSKSQARRSSLRSHCHGNSRRPQCTFQATTECAAEQNWSWSRGLNRERARFAMRFELISFSFAKTTPMPLPGIDALLDYWPRCCVRSSASFTDLE